MLFWQEMKKIIFSLSYLLFVAAVIIGLYSQGVFGFQDRPVTEPQPGGDYGAYGMKQEENPELIMPAALEKLWEEFCENDYVTYPIGFIKHVKLDEKEQFEVAKVLSEITGIDESELLIERKHNRAKDSGDFTMEIGGNMQIQKDSENSFVIQNGNQEAFHLEVKQDMEYSRFKELMAQVDDLLGGGSEYAVESLKGYGMVAQSYEEAHKQYELTVSRDKITGGYARLFSDYAVAMVMSVLPVFLSVILCMKDKRAKMEALIYTKRASSFKITAVRYFALITSVMLPVLLLSYLSNILIWSCHSGMELDYLAPLKYDFGWILPSVMISTALGMFLTELTNTPIAIAVQGLWWLFDINMGIKTVDSGYALIRLAPRHNAGAASWFKTQVFIDYFQKLVQNRLLFAVISLLLAVLTILIYGAKRKGKFHGRLLFRNRKKQSEA